MIVTINDVQLEYVNCCVCVKISDGLCEVITKKLPLITFEDEKFGDIFARTTIGHSNIDRYRGTDVTFSVVECFGSNAYVLRPVAYKRKYEGIIRDGFRLNDEYYEKAKAMVREHDRRNSMLGIKNVIHHDPATIVYWCDGTKTVVKCVENDIYDPEKGLAMAISKKVLGNEGNYYNKFKKWLPKEETNTSDNQADEQAEYIKKPGYITNKNPNESENTWGF